MNAQKYRTALTVSTIAAMKSKDITLPEIIGLLEITKINVERQAFTHAMSRQDGKVDIVPATVMPPPMAGN